MDWALHQAGKKTCKKRDKLYQFGENVKKKDIVKVLVVRQRQPFRRKDGSYVRFDENAVVLVDAKKEPIATRIFGPMPKELKSMGYEKLMTMAEEVV